MSRTRCSSGPPVHGAGHALDCATPAVCRCGLLVGLIGLGRCLFAQFGHDGLSAAGLHPKVARVLIVADATEAARYMSVAPVETYESNQPETMSSKNQAPERENAVGDRA